MLDFCLSIRPKRICFDICSGCNSCYVGVLMQSACAFSLQVFYLTSLLFFDTIPGNTFDIRKICQFIWWLWFDINSVIRANTTKNVNKKYWKGSLKCDRLSCLLNMHKYAIASNHCVSKVTVYMYCKHMHWVKFNNFLLLYIKFMICTNGLTLFAIAFLQCVWSYIYAYMYEKCTLQNTRVYFVLQQATFIAKQTTSEWL